MGIALSVPFYHRLTLFLFHCYGAHRDLHSFPTRRSSDLRPAREASRARRHDRPSSPGEAFSLGGEMRRLDRKSTRLNSSHTVISYAVFCLKKKISQLWTEAVERNQGETGVAWTDTGYEHV